MRSVLVGAVTSTQVALETLVAARAAPELVLTLPPERGHRHSDYVDLAPLCQRLDVPVAAIGNINDPPSLDLAASHSPDHVFVIGWSQVCGESFLAIPRAGAIGYHPAPLPLNRGRAVIPWTILQGASESGSTLFWLDQGVDSGPVLSQQRFGLDQRETAETLYAKHMTALASMLRSVVPALQAGSPPAVAQLEEHATYCAKRTPADGHIDWRQPADAIDRLVRATTRPYPGAFTFVQRRKIVVWKTEIYETARYSARPGQILFFDQGLPVVRCGDGADLVLSEFEVDASERLLAHQQLGFPPVWAMQ